MYTMFTTSSQQILTPSDINTVLGKTPQLTLHTISGPEPVNLVFVKSCDFPEAQVFKAKTLLQRLSKEQWPPNKRATCCTLA